MPTLDYIRLLKIITVKRGENENYEATYSIEYSEDLEFSSSRKGTLTLSISELMDLPSIDNENGYRIASSLLDQTLVRKKSKDRSVCIYHAKGETLADWMHGNCTMLSH